jgi:cytochrome P450
MTETIPATSLLDPAVIDDPYSFYRRLRTHAPVWEVPGTGLFTVSSFELLAEAARRVEDFSSNLTCLLYRDDHGLPCRLSVGELGMQALATADPPDHVLHRRTVFPDLVAKRMIALEPDIRELADEGVTRALGAGTVDFMSEIGNIVPITMISRLIGFHDSDLDQLLQAAFDSTAILGSTFSYDELIAALTRSAEIQVFITEQLHDGMRSTSEDLLGAVVRGIEDEVFTEPQAGAVLHTLLSAGGESTTSLLGNSVRMLAENPELQDHLRHNLDLLPNFIEEALRLEAPFRFHMRSINSDTSLGGVDIPADSTLLMLWGAANRDEAEFDRPNEIDLHRTQPRHHVSFGRGMHLCVGAQLARVEARSLLTVMLERTSNIELDPDHAPEWVNSLMVRRHDVLPIRLTA